MIVDGELRRLHERHSWLPFTQMKDSSPWLARGGDGVWLELEDGRRVIDGIGSWWVNVYGHANPHIARAIADQASRLEQVIYANFVHEPGLLLSARLSARTGHRLPRAFFSDNGSTAVEIAIKMAYQFFRNSGDKRDLIVCLENGYHGDTFGAMAAGGRTAFHRVFEPLLFDVLHLPSPVCTAAGLESEAVASHEMAAALEALDDVFREQGHRIACLLLEPLIQGAGGMRMYHPLYLREARRLCNQTGALLVADEVFSGSGRTGNFFAFERSGTWPDIMALSKGLTGGFLPLAATLASEAVYNGFLGGEGMHTLYHGHSMTGSPLGCVAALASMDLFESLAIPERVLALESRARGLLHQLAAGPAGDLVSNPRTLGSVAAFDVPGPVSYGGRFSAAFTTAAIDEGVYVRPLAGTIYTTPAFTITEEEQAAVFAGIERALLRCRPLFGEP